MYTLHVSHDQGHNYEVEKESDNINDFDEVCKRLDNDNIRWYFKKNNEMWYDRQCYIYKLISRSVEGKPIF